jgi:hypothetical protein
MKYDFTHGLSDDVLEKVRKHTIGIENQKTRVLKCHFCGHKAIKVFEDSRGHVQAKCKKCNCESIYNVVLRRDGTVMFRRVRG